MGACDKRRLAVGIDPGQHGVVAVLFEEDNASLLAPLPYEDEERKVLAVGHLYDFLRNVVSIHTDGQIIAVLEKVQGDPKFGGGRAFTFGSGYGQITATLRLALRDELRDGRAVIKSPVPRTWQGKLLPPLPDGLTPYKRKKALKERSLAAVRERHPKMLLRFEGDRQDNDNIADALNLAHYGLAF